MELPTSHLSLSMIFGILDQPVNNIPGIRSIVKGAAWKLLRNIFSLSPISLFRFLLANKHQMGTVTGDPVNYSAPSLSNSISPEINKGLLT